MTRNQPRLAAGAAVGVSEDRGRLVVQSRSHGRCEACQRPATDWSHRVPRSQGGTWAVANGIFLCRGCHHWCHQHLERHGDVVNAATHRPVPAVEIADRLATAEVAAFTAGQVAGRLRALVCDVVTAAFHGPAPDWLTDDLWGRLVAETPTPDEWQRTRSAAQETGLW